MHSFSAFASSRSEVIAAGIEIELQFLWHGTLEDLVAALLEWDQRAPAAAGSGRTDAGGGRPWAHPITT